VTTIPYDPTLPFDPFGTDIALSDTGDLIVSGSGSLGTMSGPDNAVQALRLRTRTAIGELDQHPSYGSVFPSLVGSKASRAAMSGQAGAELRRLLAQDDRFLYYEDLTVEESQEAGGAAFKVGVTLALISGDELAVRSLSDAQVDAVVETVSSDELVAFASGDDDFTYITQDEDEADYLADVDEEAALRADLERDATAEEEDGR
jgi:hypothetical protein